MHAPEKPLPTSFTLKLLPFSFIFYWHIQMQVERDLHQLLSQLGNIYVIFQTLCFVNLNIRTQCLSPLMKVQMLKKCPCELYTITIRPCIMSHPNHRWLLIILEGFRASMLFYMQCFNLCHLNICLQNKHNEVANESWHVYDLIA